VLLALALRLLGWTSRVPWKRTRWRLPTRVRQFPFALYNQCSDAGAAAAVVRVSALVVVTAGITQYWDAHTAMGLCLGEHDMNDPAAIGRLLGDVVGFVICLFSAILAYNRAKHRGNEWPFGHALAAFLSLPVYWTIVLICVIVRAIARRSRSPAAPV
jgi:hypothetical protein